MSVGGCDAIAFIMHNPSERFCIDLLTNRPNYVETVRIAVMSIVMLMPLTSMTSPAP